MKRHRVTCGPRTAGRQHGRPVVSGRIITIMNGVNDFFTKEGITEKCSSVVEMSSPPPGMCTVFGDIIFTLRSDVKVIGHTKLRLDMTENGFFNIPTPSHFHSHAAQWTGILQTYLQLTWNAEPAGTTCNTRHASLTADYVLDPVTRQW